MTNYLCNKWMFFTMQLFKWVKLSIIMIISDLHIYLCIRKLYMESEYCLQFTYMLELGRWRLIWSEVQQLTGSKQKIAVSVTDFVHCTPWMQTYHPSVIRKCIILYKFLFFRLIQIQNFKVSLYYFVLKTCSQLLQILFVNEKKRKKFFFGRHCLEEGKFWWVLDSDYVMKLCF